MSEPDAVERALAWYDRAGAELVTAEDVDAIVGALREMREAARAVLPDKDAYLPDVSVVSTERQSLRRVSLSAPSRPVTRRPAHPRGAG